MPFKVVKINNYYKILKINTNTLAKPKFNSRKAAQNQMKNWMRYAHRFTKNTTKSKRKKRI